MTSLHESVTTTRLLLRALTEQDTDDVHALHADPAVWKHFPQGRHDERTKTEQLVDQVRSGWRETGLDYWAVRVREDQPGSPNKEGVVGVAGVGRRRESLWNLYYRFRPDVQGRGYASEVAAAALDAAREVDSSLPIIAYLLEHNVASARTAERAGLRLAWRGADREEPGAVRLIYSDRDLPALLLDELTSR